MKRLISIFLTLSMLISMTMIVSVMPVAAATLPTPYFKMVINEGTTTTDHTITNGAAEITGSTIDMTAINDSAYSTYNETAEGTPYLTFATIPDLSAPSTATNGNAGIRVSLPSGTNLQNGDTSWEMWIKAPYLAAKSNQLSKAIFALVQTGQNSTDKEVIRLRLEGNNSDTNSNLAFMPDRIATLKNANSQTQTTSLSQVTAAYADEWMHVVVVRDIEDTTADETTTRTYNTAVYVNGYKMSNTTNTALTSTDATTTGYDDIFIGTHGSGGAFRGSIGAFNVYRSAVTDTDVRNMYEATAEAFYPDFDKNKLFEMKLTAGATTDGVTAYTVEDAVNRSTFVTDAGITGTGCATAETPLYMKEGDVEFLRFTYKTTNSETGLENNYYEHASSQITFEMNDLTFADSATMTFETWARDNYMDHTSANAMGSDGQQYAIKRRSLFAFGDHPGLTRLSSHEAFSVEFGGESGAYDDVTMVFDTTADAATKVALGDASAHNEKWAHYVVTREWTPTDASAPFGAGTWKSTLYINGSLVGTQTSSATSRTNHADLMSKLTSTDRQYTEYLAIGGTNKKEPFNSFPGDIATFEVYNSILSPEEITAKFSATAGKYISSDLSISGLFLNQNEENLTSSNIASATKVTASNAVLENHYGEAPFAILAVYKGETLVKCVKMETEVISSGTGLTGELEFEEGSVDDVRLFVWESADTIRPLCSVYGL